MARYSAGMPVLVLVLALIIQAAAQAEAEPRRPGLDPGLGAEGAAAQAARILELFGGLDVRATQPPPGAALAAVSAAWFGYTVADATAALQAAIDSGAAAVLVPDMGSPWILARTIRLRSGLELIFAPGAELRAAPGAFRGTGEVLVEARSLERLRITGYGAAWVMRGAEYGRKPYEPSQWRHALEIRGGRDITVAGLRIADSGGDGIYVGTAPAETAGAWRLRPERVLLRDLELSGHRRQGLSLISARELRVLNCRVTDTGGTAPGAGIDFEPNSGDEGFLDCLIASCELSGNAGPALLVALGRLRGEAPPIAIRVEDSILAGAPIAFSLTGAGSRPGTIDFLNCELRGLRWIGAHPGLRLDFGD